MEHEDLIPVDRASLRGAGVWLLAAAVSWWVAAAATGVALAARSFRTSPPALLRVAAALAVVGGGGWAAEVVVRLTATVERARDVAVGTAVASGEPAIGHWGLFAVAALGFVAPVLCAWALAGRRLPGRRASAVVAVLVTLSTLAAMLTLAPSIVYQFGALALGLPLVISRRAGTGARARNQGVEARVPTAL